MPVPDPVTLPFGLSPPLAIAIVAGILILVGIWSKRRRAAERGRAYEVAGAEAGDWEPTIEPLGLTTADLEVYPFTTAGSGERGVEFGLEGQLDVQRADGVTTVPAATFVWHHQTYGTGETRSTRPTDHRTVVGLARLPVAAPEHVLIEPQNAIRRRLGLSTGEVRLGSEAFQRSFVVTTRDAATAQLLIDPAFEQLLLDRFAGRTIMVSLDRLVLPADPDTRDPQTPGPPGLFPGLRDDLTALVDAIPAAYWQREGPAAPAQQPPPPASPSPPPTASPPPPPPPPPHAAGDADPGNAG